jgi:hypothetical protein
LGEQHLCFHDRLAQFGEVQASHLIFPGKERMLPRMAS